MTKLLLTFMLIALGAQSRADENVLLAEDAMKEGAPLANYRYLAPHPLYPYLQYRDFRNHLEQTPSIVIVNFLNRYPRAPFSGWLAEQAFPLWLSRGDYQAIIKGFDPSLADESIECEYRLALLNTGRKQQAAAGIDNLWLSPKSIESACDPLFNALLSNGQIKQSLIGERFFLAMEKNNISLANYLARLLAGQAGNAAQTWLAIDSGQLGVERAYSINDSKWRSAMISDQLIKNLKKSPDQVIDQAMFANSSHYFKNPKDAGRLFNAIVRKTAQDDDPRTVAAWNAIPKGEHDNNIIFDFIAYEQRRGDWRNLPQYLLNQLSDEDLKKAEVQYWIAKSFEKMGDRSRANSHYHQAAKQRDIFGFLAAEKIGQKPNMNDHPVRANSDYSHVASRPAAYRAKIWHSLGDNSRATQEWQSLLKDLSDEQISQAALYAHEIGWELQAILTLSKNKNWDALSLRFPVQYEKQVRNLARQHQISPAAIYAIIRKESIFQPDVISPVGAIGLMQVMPATANATARRYGIPYSGKSQLTNPYTNLEIGSQYLADQLKTYGHLAYAAAAYNAGPNRVKRWQERYPTLSLDEWIAQIPFYETRDYVKRVLEYEKVYEYRLNLPYSSLKNSHPHIW